MNEKRSNLSRMKKYHNNNFKKHKFINVAIIFVVLIGILYAISNFSNNTNQHNSSIQSKSSSHHISKSRESFSSSTNNANSSISTTSSNNGTNPIENNTFTNLQSAINYGKQCIANGQCNNFKVVNDNGKYLVQLY